MKSLLQFGNPYLITFAGAIGGGLSFVTPSGITGVAGAITFKGTANNAGCVSPPEVACLDLPIFVGTQSSQVPIDFQDGNSGAGGMSISTTNTTSGAIVTATIDVRAKSGFYTLELLDTNGTSPPPANLKSNPDPSTGWDHFTFEIPSIFALLSDPASLVDGLDKVLQTIQEAFQGQIFGIKLPFIGDALSSANGVAKDIESFRVNVLQKLSATIRNNNLDLDHLTQFLQKAIFDGLAGLHLLQQVAPDGSLLGAVQTLTALAK